MTANEALQIYVNKDIVPNALLCQQKAMEYLDKNFITIKENFIQSFRESCKNISKIQYEGEEFKVGYIQYSLIYSSIREGKLIYRTEFFDENWYFGKVIHLSDNNIEWLSGYINELNEIIKKESRKYMGKVAVFDGEKFLLEEIKLYHEVIESIVKHCLFSMLDLDELKGLQKEAEVPILFGEYRGEVKKLYTISDLSERIREGLNGIFYAETV